VLPALLTFDEADERRPFLLLIGMLNMFVESHGIWYEAVGVDPSQPDFWCVLILLKLCLGVITGRAHVASSSDT